jgi:Arc/MetJ-type ribon-helix-helix transcriptional regulator
MAFFETIIQIRITEDMRKRIQRVCKRDKLIFEDPSEFVRASIISLLNKREKLSKSDLKRERRSLI